MIGSPEKSMTKQKLEEQVSNAIFYFFIQQDIKKIQFNSIQFNSFISHINYRSYYIYMKGSGP